MHRHEKGKPKTPTADSAAPANDSCTKLKLLEETYKTSTDSLENELNNARKIVKNVNEKLHSMHKDVLKKDSEIKGLNQRMTIKDEELATKEEHLTALKERYKQMDSDFFEFKQRVYGIDILYDKNIYEAKEKINQLEEKLTKMEEERSRNMKQIEMLREDMQKAELESEQKLLELQTDFSNHKIQAETERAENQALIEQLHQSNKKCIEERDAKENEYKNKIAEQGYKLVEIERRLKFQPTPRSNSAGTYARITCVTTAQVRDQNANPEPEIDAENNDFEDTTGDSELHRIVNAAIANIGDESSSICASTRHSLDSSVDENIDITVVRATSESSNKF